MEVFGYPIIANLSFCMERGACKATVKTGYKQNWWWYSNFAYSDDLAYTRVLTKQVLAGFWQIYKSNRP